jgi:basic membrane lipoprotein Med (substrate-binding protein (PBP1-ABC) superfamily)
VTEPRVSAEQVLSAVHNAQDQLAELQARTLTPDEVAQAVAQGLTQAVSRPEFWAAALNAASSRAKSEAGSWLFGGIGAVLAKLAWVLVLGMSIYLLGGWTALMGFLKSGAPHN